MQSWGHPRFSFRIVFPRSLCWIALFFSIRSPPHRCPSWASFGVLHGLASLLAPGLSDSDSVEQAHLAGLYLPPPPGLRCLSGSLALGLSFLVISLPCAGRPCWLLYGLSGFRGFAVLPSSAVFKIYALSSSRLAVQWCIDKSSDNLLASLQQNTQKLSCHRFTLSFNSAVLG